MGRLAGEVRVELAAGESRAGQPCQPENLKSCEPENLAVRGPVKGYLRYADVSDGCAKRL
jgi:hypothetical protein